MTPNVFLEIIKHGLPGCKFQQVYVDQLICRVKYGGHLFDIQGGNLDGYPLWLVTTPEFHLNKATNEVLCRLDSMTEEYLEQEKPWGSVDALIKRLQEMREDLADDDTDDFV